MKPITISYPLLMVAIGLGFAAARLPAAANKHPAPDVGPACVAPTPCGACSTACARRGVSKCGETSAGVYCTCGEGATP